MFYELVRSILLTICEGNMSLADGLVLIYEFKEQNKDGYWKTWRMIFPCSEHHLGELRDHELFYEKQPYHWQPMIVSLTNRGWMEGDVNVEGKSFVVSGFMPAVRLVEPRPDRLGDLPYVRNLPCTCGCCVDCAEYARTVDC